MKPKLNLFYYSGISFAFENTSYVVSEDIGTFNVCVKVESGFLQRDISFNITSTNDSDPRTLNGNSML